MYKQGVVMEIGFFAVIGTALLSMVIGAVWYSPVGLGKTWRKLVGMTEAEFKAGNQTNSLVIVGVLTLTEMFMLALFLQFSSFYYPEFSDWIIGLLTGWWAWVGFVFPALAMTYMFAKRRKKLLAIDAGYHLVALSVAGVLLAIWQ